jgi:hypothetical protein
MNQLDEIVAIAAVCCPGDDKQLFGRAFAMRGLL